MDENGDVEVISEKCSENLNEAFPENSIDHFTAQTSESIAEIVEPEEKSEDSKPMNVSCGIFSALEHAVRLLHIYPRAQHFL